jgi:glycosyltransferase involved in cell wall biosynthesis
MNVLVGLANPAFELSKDKMKLIIFARYTSTQASTRVRFLQFSPSLILAGFKVELYSILDDASLSGKSSTFEMILLRVTSLVRVVRQVFTLKQPFLLHIHIELLPWVPYFIESVYLKSIGIKHYSIELDDAWFHRYENHTSIFVRYFLGDKINKLMKNASVVIAGNQYIADKAMAVGAKYVEVIPTVVDTDKYVLDIIVEKDCLEIKAQAKPVIGWIGSPATTKFLIEIQSVIKYLHNNNIATFVAFGADAILLKDLPIKTVPWDESKEVETLYKFDIGIMPLTDSLFERGKCGYKLIQYMACSLPVVAAPVGVNNSIVVHGESGFLASNDSEWIQFLSLLCADANLRASFGRAGLRRVIEHYSLIAIAPKVVSIFKNISQD